MRYYRVETYTPYVGEHTDHYVMLADGADIESEEYTCLFDDWAADNATEWWDEGCEEDYDCYEDYLAECGYTVYEITEEEYEEASR